MKRKLLSLLLTVFMVLTMVPISAVANDSDTGDMYTMQIAVDTVTADVESGTVKVNISVTRNSGIAAMNYRLMYDNSVLTLESEPVVGELSGFDLTNGPIDASSHVAMLVAEKNVIGDGTLVTYTFKVNPDADAGTYDITLLTSGKTNGGIALEVLDEDYNAVSHTVVNGSVTIPGFTIAYDANGGLGAPASVTKTGGKDVAISAIVPVRSGYNFLGWATSKDATEAEYKAGDVYSMNADVTLYAVWEEIVSTPGTVVLEAGIAEAKVGQEVSVSIDITSNPGVGSMAFDVVYDNTRLELLSYDNPYSCTISAVDRYEDKVNVRYVNLGNTIDGEIEYTGNFITLNFKVKDTASDGIALVKIVPYEDEFYKHEGANLDEVDVAVSVTNGGVNVSSTVVGDLNGDGRVNPLDCSILERHLAGWEGYEAETFTYAAADLNGDGRVNPLDCSILERHLAGWGGYETLPFAG